MTFIFLIAATWRSYFATAVHWLGAEQNTERSRKFMRFVGYIYIYIYVCVCVCVCVCVRARARACVFFFTFVSVLFPFCFCFVLVFSGFVSVILVWTWPCVSRVSSTAKRLHLHKIPDQRHKIQPPFTDISNIPPQSHRQIVERGLQFLRVGYFPRSVRPVCERYASDIPQRWISPLRGWHGRHYQIPRSKLPASYLERASSTVIGTGRSSSTPRRHRGTPPKAWTSTALFLGGG
jgi:hypothetical protein